MKRAPYARVSGRFLKSRRSEMLFSAFSTRYFVKKNQFRTSVK